MEWSFKQRCDTLFWVQVSGVFPYYQAKIWYFSLEWSHLYDIPYLFSQFCANCNWVGTTAIVPRTTTFLVQSLLQQIIDRSCSTAFRSAKGWIMDTNTFFSDKKWPSFILKLKLSLCLIVNLGGELLLCYFMSTNLF